MEIKVFTPDDGYVRTNAVTVFLAGPINGALTWREKFVKRIADKLIDKDGRLTFFNPQRADAFKKSTDLNQNEYEHQIEWEKYHLNTADIIVFVIPKKEFEVEDYARTTRYELGEWITKINLYKQIIDNRGSIKPPRIQIWIDDSFHGKRYISYQASTSIDPIRIQNFAELNELENDLCRLIYGHRKNGENNLFDENLSVFLGKPMK